MKEGNFLVDNSLITWLEQDRKAQTLFNTVAILGAVSSICLGLVYIRQQRLSEARRG